MWPTVPVSDEPFSQSTHGTIKCPPDAHFRNLPEIVVYPEIFLPIVLWRLWIWAYYFVHMLFFAYYNQLINQHTFSKQRLLHSKPICNFFLQVSSESQSFAQVYGFCSARVHFICSSCAQTPSSCLVLLSHSQWFWSTEHHVLPLFPNTNQTWKQLCIVMWGMRFTCIPN